jgi:hypothetical protein
MDPSWTLLKRFDDQAFNNFLFGSKPNLGHDLVLQDILNVESIHKRFQHITCMKMKKPKVLT